MLGNHRHHQLIAHIPPAMAVPRSRILDLMKVCLSDVFGYATARILILQGPMSNLLPYLQPRGSAVRKQSPAPAIKGTGPGSILPTEDGHIQGIAESISRLAGCG